MGWLNWLEEVISEPEQGIWCFEKDADKDYVLKLDEKRHDQEEREVLNQKTIDASTND